MFASLGKSQLIGRDVYTSVSKLSLVVLNSTFEVATGNLTNVNDFEFLIYFFAVLCHSVIDIISLLKLASGLNEDQRSRVSV